MFNAAKTFSSFSVSDLDKARDFYRDKLGIEVTEHEDELDLNLEGGTQILLYIKPNHTPATFTILNFLVEDIEQAVDALTARGVRFEQYDGFMKTDIKGIFRTEGLKQAWFQDPAGNILSLLEQENP